MVAMLKIDIMSSRDVKPVLEYLKVQYGPVEFSDIAWLRMKDNHLHIISRDVEHLDFSKLHINALGLYVGEWKFDELRLSVEGCQLVGKFAKKNVVELSDVELEAWLRGEDVVKSVDGTGFQLVRHGVDFFGVGRSKDGKILNFFPKSRRLLTPHPVGQRVEENQV